ncbi:MAG: nickel-type superoxide dismutase maturation protease [Prochlorococcus sp.]
MLTPGSPPAESTPVPQASLRQLILLLLGRRRQCRVDGLSMLPTFADGDVVIYRPISSNEAPPEPGSIVVAHHPEKPGIMIIKRLKKITDDGFDLRGDNKNSSTDSRHFGEIKSAQLAGVVESLLL